MLENANVDIAWESFTSKLILILDKHAPYRKITASVSLPKWVTRQYIEACDEQDYHHREYAKNKTPENLAKKKRSRNMPPYSKIPLKISILESPLEKARVTPKHFGQKYMKPSRRTSQKTLVLQSSMERHLQLK